MSNIVNYLQVIERGKMTYQEGSGSKAVVIRKSPMVLAALAILVLIATQGCIRVDGPGVGGGNPAIGGGSPSVGGLMTAAVRILEQPRGGTNVTELSCVLEVAEIADAGSAPIAILVSWVAPCGTHKAESFLFEGGSETYESVYAEGGYPIGMTFWVSITWQDASGSHQIRSDVAACSIR